MDNSLYEWITIESHGKNAGDLLMFEEGTNLPFKVEKVLVVKNVPTDAVRGKHAHKTVKEIVVPLQGGCVVDVTDGTRTESVTLDSPGKPLLLPALVWRTLHHFQPDTILLIIADGPYDEADYLRNYDEFLTYLAEQKKD